MPQNFEYEAIFTVDCHPSPNISGMGILALTNPIHIVSMIASCRDVVPKLPIAS